MTDPARQTWLIRVPDISVAHRLIVLRTVKRMRRLLSEDGPATGIVPMDVWRDPAA